MEIIRLMTNGESAQHKKALKTMLILILSELWKERNVRVFRNMSVPMGVILVRTKGKASLWSIAGAKSLSNVMTRE